MRIKISFKTENNDDAKIPYNYNHQLSSALYSKIVDKDYQHKLHTSQDFKFFNFSQIFINKLKTTDNYLIARKGDIHIYISSPNDYFLTNMVNGFLTEPYLKLNNQYFEVKHMEEITLDNINNTENIKTISPVISRTKKEVNGKLRVWDLAPGDHFYKNLENNLIKKYEKYNKINSTDKQIHFTSQMRSVKQKRIEIKKNNNIIYQRGYMMDLTIEGNLDLIKFAYDCGIGEGNSMGFGMITKNKK